MLPLPSEMANNDICQIDAHRLDQESHKEYLAESPEPYGCYTTETEKEYNPADDTRSDSEPSLPANPKPLL